MKTAALDLTSRDFATEANFLVKDLQRVNLGIYWVDLLVSVVVGWGAFAGALVLSLPLAAAAAAISAVALYRALCFIHEISHQSRRTLPGFEPVWNLTTGFPLLLPSCMYVGVHSGHHRLSTYGTQSDPEYLPFARSIRMTAAFAIQSLLLPLALAVRFLLLGPISFFVPRFERWLVVHSSSLSMNVRYCRDAAPETLRMVRRQNVGILIFWVALVIAAPVKFFVLWYLISAAISLTNSLRTLGAHAYASDGEPLGREEQLQDSIDTPAGRWGVLWAPVGLRFHALHHYFPGIPYHNLGKAYARLTTKLPSHAAIHHVRSGSLVQSLTALCRRGLRKTR
ncbi:MAG TPA: fatty acid desaturase [Bryobacteraceae bacterium]|jgi:fatty acid desaturase|nr:fatty acid desaturase [Bryobacteraceae bacterium]